MPTFPPPRSKWVGRNLDNANLVPYKPVRLERLYRNGVYLPPPILRGSLCINDPKDNIIIELFNKWMGVNLPTLTGEVTYSKMMSLPDYQIHIVSNEIAYCYGYPYFSRRATDTLCGMLSLVNCLMENTPRFMMYEPNSKMCTKCSNIIKTHGEKVGYKIMKD